MARARKTQRNIRTVRNSSVDLFNAAFAGNVREVERLIATGADLNIQDVGGATPLFIASEYGYLNIVDKLLHAGADVNKAKVSGVTPVYIAATRGHLDVVQRLLQAGADVNKARTDIGTTPLYIASEFNKVDIVDRLLQAGADTNKPRTDVGITPLYIASELGHLSIVDKLLQAGADVNKARTDIGVTPLYIASELGHLSIVDKLLQAGADVNKARTDIGVTPLFVASEYGHLSIVDKLLQAGADVNKARTDMNITPLHVAVELGHYAVAKRLLEAGADKTIATKDGMLPIDYAGTKELRALLSDAVALKWEGWTRGDAAKLDGIFGDDETAKNFALCPVCMKYVQRSDACMYMSHNCATSKGYYHDALYQKYKNSEGIINWCTICGRICKGHNHFKLGPADGDVPNIHFGEDPFAASCEGEGGGGLNEKLLRFRRLREHARDLQAEVGKLGWWEAMDELCEEMWNAPMFRSRALRTMQEAKKFNIPNTNFPITLPPQNNAPNVPYSGETPVVHPTETETMTNALYIDDTNILQFRHKKADGTWNRHEGPGQQISRAAFVGWLKAMLENPATEEFGKCWQYKTRSQQAALSDAEKALVCTATLHPAEVKAALDMDDEEQAGLAEGYRKVFNAVFDTRRTRRQ